MSDSPDIAVTRLDEPVEIFAGFGRLALPDALDGLLLRIGDSERFSGIERFAFRTLSVIDRERLRKLAAAHAILVGFPRATMIYLGFKRTDVRDEDVAFLFSVEAALNRVLGVLNHLGFGLSPATSSPSVEDCSVIEQTVLKRITSRVESLFEDVGAHNPWMEFGSGLAEPGGEWDLRTRLASLLESLDLIVRLEYGFRCDARAGAVRVSFVGPIASEMPSSIYDARSGSWLDLTDGDRQVMAREYAYRMALVLMAAGFAAGLLVSRVIIELRDPAPSGHILCLSISRTSFIGTAIDLARRLDGAALEGQAARGLADTIQHERVALDVSSELARPPREDDRVLPEPLRDLLLADTARELEVMESSDDPYMKRFVELGQRKSRDEEVMGDLAELVDELDAIVAADELAGDGPLQTQFCENHVGRILLPLLEDDRRVRIARAPDALYLARRELANGFLDAGAIERAIGEARVLLDLASTSMQAHFTLINILASAGRYADLLDVAQHGLRLAYDRDAIAYLYYRAAFALWRLGRNEEAIACYTLVPQGEYMSALAEEELKALLSASGIRERPSTERAGAIAARFGMPLAPTPEVMRQIADAAVLLADSGFFFLASRCAHHLWLILGREELGALSRSFL